MKKNYLAMQKSLDDNIELMNYLNSTQKDSNGNNISGTSLNDNTIIFFLSDNGGTNKKGPINSPLRGLRVTNGRGLACTICKTARWC